MIYHDHGSFQILDPVDAWINIRITAGDAQVAFRMTADEAEAMTERFREVVEIARRNTQ